MTQWMLFMVCSIAQSSRAFWISMDCRPQASLSFTISQSLLRLIYIESMMPSKHFFLCHSLLLMTENKCWTNDKTTVSNNLSCPSSSGLVFSDSGSFPCFSSVQSLVISNSLRPLELKHTRPPCPLPTPGVHSNSRPLNGDAIQPSHPLSSPSPPVPNPFQHQNLFQWVNSSHEVAKVLEFQL